jgi:hypothetical protein
VSIKDEMAADAVRIRQKRGRHTPPASKGVSGSKAAGQVIGAQFDQVKKAFDFGGEPNDLSARTGIAVGDIAVLRQKFCLPRLVRTEDRWKIRSGVLRLRYRPSEVVDQYLTISTVGERARAFVPSPLPPAPPVEGIPDFPSADLRIA